MLDSTVGQEPKLDEAVISGRPPGVVATSQAALYFAL